MKSTKSDRIIIDTNSYLSSLSSIIKLKSLITLPLAVIMELQGLSLNARTETQAVAALSWIKSKPSNLILVTYTGVVVKEIMSETWNGRVDDLILDLAINCRALVTADVNLRLLARTRDINVIERIQLVDSLIDNS
jgi:rRNA-processing protein FCF1